MQPLKTPKSYIEQIDNLIKNHGLTVADPIWAEEVLSRVNYYRLSAYGLGLCQPGDKERYLPGISIEHIYGLYQFDCRLRNLITPVIELLEIELRSRIAYHLAMTYGAEGYRDPAKFVAKTTKDGDDVHALTMRKLGNEIIQGASKPCVLHHQTKYGGHFPIWAAIELFNVGMIASLYSIMVDIDQEAIAVQFCTRRGYLIGWIQSLREVRNICAHYGRLYNMPLMNRPYLYTENIGYASNRLFPVILTMGRMTRDKEVWAVFLDGLSELIAAHREVNLTFIGFPANWKEVLKP